MSTTLRLETLTHALIDRLIETAAMHPTGAIHKPALTEWAEAKFGAEAPQGVGVETCLTALIGAFHDHADPPLVLRTGLRGALRVEIDRMLLEERAAIAARLYDLRQPPTYYLSLEQFVDAVEDFERELRGEA